jgi:hypothetical protein
MGAGSSAVNLLNAGWTATVAIPLPDGGWTLPTQALSVFIEAPWDQLNRLHKFEARLVDDEEHPAHFVPGPERGAPEARIQQQVVVPPVPGAPNGTPGLTCVFLDVPLGSLWLPAPRHRYIWKITVGGAEEEIGFWAQAPPQAPIIGGGPMIPPPITGPAPSGT